MIGHSKIIEDLKALHERATLGHGYIFFGPSMVGKRTAAVAFANFLESGDFNEPTGTLSDLMIIDSHGKSSIGIDAVREIKNFLWQKPNVSPRRTLIIDDAHLLTKEAQNALLKITEEPPASSLLILVTPDIESIMPTILSRLPKIYFGSVYQKEIERWLASATKGNAKTGTGEAAEKSFGKPGLAWRLLHDQEFQKDITLAEKLLKTPATTRRDLIKKIIEPEDFDFRKFLDAVIMVLAWQKSSKTKATFWHKALGLYDRETNFSLNPRLQLENLLR